MVSKIRAVMADENLVDYIWAAVPIVAIILGIIAFAAISLARGG